MVARVPFPEDWSILIIQPPGPRGRHGPDEAQAFAELPPLPESTTDRLCRLVLLGMLPAVVERDLPAFGQALTEIQHYVGAAFAPWQGGRYSSPDAEALIAMIKGLGLMGAGQSSWGPTLYAFSSLTEPERNRISAWLHEQSGLAPGAICWTRAANSGATLVCRQN
jgi:beta-RFAP synthase